MKLCKVLFGVLMVVSVAFGASVVNSRLVPDTLDYTSHGSASLNKARFLLMKDLANILPATAGEDGINVDSIRSNPDVDSLAGSIIIDTLVGARNGGVIINDSLKVVNQVLAAKVDADTLNGSMIIDTLVGLRAGGVIINDSAKIVNELMVSKVDADTIKGATVVRGGRLTLNEYAIAVDSIVSAPIVDTIAGNVVFSGRPQFNDRLYSADSLTVGGAGAGNLTVGGGAEIDSITINDATNDTLIIKIGGKVFKIDCDSDA